MRHWFATTRQRLLTVDAPRLVRVVVSLAMLMYALGCLTRPAVGIVGFISATYGVPATTLALAFAFCAGALLFNQVVSPFTFTLLTTPMALFALASVGAWALGDAVGTPTAVASHFGFWLTVNIFQWIEVTTYGRE